jgi:uncharacterized damage-inducible protein DinB
MLRARVVLACCLFAAATAAFARTPAQTQQQAVPAAAKSGFRGEFFANLDEVEEKLLALADATPADRYTWRPGSAADIRSNSEVFMHIAGGNYFLSTFIGAKAPANLKPDMETKVTSKQEVVAHLRKSFHHLRAAVNALSEADLQKGVKMFGKQTTYRAVLITMLTHLHEHLGQSIAYSRMNGVVPPWSR